MGKLTGDMGGTGQSMGDLSKAGYSKADMWKLDPKKMGVMTGINAAVSGLQGMQPQQPKMMPQNPFWGQ
jgi:hypothetical protein